MAVGFPAKTNFATGDVLTATNMNDVTGTLNLLESAQYAAGKNEIINGAFNVWQRGTSFNQTYFNAGSLYTADRMAMLWNNVPTSVTVSQQAFTPGAAPVAGYEGTFFLRSLITTVGTCTVWGVQQRIEDVRTLANQTATISFYAKADTARNVTIELTQKFGSGGSSSVNVTTTVQAVTTSWARYSLTVTVPSISGKTVGTSSYLELNLVQAVAAGSTLDVWGLQIEPGSTASPFQTASGTIQGELALCQRYYYRNSQTSTGVAITNNGGSLTTTLAEVVTKLPVTMRVNPTALETLSIAWYNYGNVTLYSSGTWTMTSATPDFVTVRYTHGSAVFTAGQVGTITSNANPSYIAFTAEL